MSVLAAEMDSRRAGVRRVLVYRLGSLGDTVVALPSLHLVLRTFPDAERRLLTNYPVAAKAPAAKAVLEGSGLIHSYERYLVGTRSLWQLLGLAWRIRRYRPDVLVYLVAARGIATAERDRKFFRWLCGVRWIVGVPLTGAMQGHSRLADGALEPEASRLARNLSQLGDAELHQSANWSMHLSEAEQQRALAAISPFSGMKFLAVCVGTKVQSKDWGSDNWRALLERLASTCVGYATVLMGAGEEAAASDFAAGGWRSVKSAGPLLNLCGELSPRESAALLARADVFIGHDSGPMHLAASVGTPCVAVFAARNRPRVWFPYGERHRVIYHQVDCSGCGLETCVEQRKKCLLSITVDEVVTAVQDVLQEREA